MKSWQLSLTSRQTPLFWTSCVIYAIATGGRSNQAHHMHRSIVALCDPCPAHTALTSQQVGHTRGNGQCCVLILDVARWLATSRCCCCCAVRSQENHNHRHVSAHPTRHGCVAVVVVLVQVQAQPFENPGARTVLFITSRPCYIPCPSHDVCPGCARSVSLRDPRKVCCFRGQASPLRRRGVIVSLCP